MYTTSTAILEAMREAGMDYLFANLGSDHSGFVETLAEARAAGRERAFPQLITCPNEMRGQVTALFLFIFNVFGTGLAPFIVGLITDYVVGSEAKIAYSIAITAAITGPLACLMIWSGMKSYARSVARARAWT